MAEKNGLSKQIFACWKNTSKNGNVYYTGKLNGKDIIGFPNGKKKNPKEPDIRLYKKDDQGKQEEKEFLSLWTNVSAAGTHYLTGTLNNKKVIGFASKTKNEKAPAFSVYYSEPKKDNEDKEAGKKMLEVPDVAEPEENPFL